MFSRILFTLFIVFTVFRIPAQVTCRKHGRIINGTDAQENQWRFAVVIQRSYPEEPSHYVTWCTGSIISDRFVITAAHCIATQEGIVPNDALRIYAGHVSIENQNPNYQFGVKRIIFHPEYSEPNFYNDIALIELNTTIDFQVKHSRLSCAEKADSSEVILGRHCIAVGWGRTTTSNTAKILQQANLPLIDNYWCGKYDPFYLSTIQLCAGYLEGGMDACSGDSGGPFLCPIDLNNGYVRYAMIGLVSFGRGCAEPENPGYYTRLSAHWEWIEKSIDC